MSASPHAFWAVGRTVVGPEMWAGVTCAVNGDLLISEDEAPEHCDSPLITNHWPPLCAFILTLRWGVANVWLWARCCSTNGRSDKT